MLKSKRVSSLSLNAFTLIEVMVAVVIISTVIMALIQLSANNRHIFSILEKKSQTNQYLSFMISNPEYGFENKKTRLYDLVNEFDLESSLRRKLKEIKSEIIYHELDTIDMADFDPDKEDTTKEEISEEIEKSQEQSSNSGLVFEIGKTVIRLDEASTSILRIRLQ